jgi:hypothetical protein
MTDVAGFPDVAGLPVGDSDAVAAALVNISTRDAYAFAKAWYFGLIRWGELVEIERDGQVLAKLPARILPVSQKEAAGEGIFVTDLSVLISGKALEELGATTDLDQTDIVRRYPERKPTADQVLRIKEPPFTFQVGPVPILVRAIAGRAGD